MSGVAADINMWSFAMSDDEIESLYSFFPRGNVMNEDTIRIAGTLTQTLISVPKSVLPGRVSIQATKLTDLLPDQLNLWIVAFLTSWPSWQIDFRPIFRLPGQLSYLLTYRSIDLSTSWPFDLLTEWIIDQMTFRFIGVSTSSRASTVGIALLDHIWIIRELRLLSGFCEFPVAMPSIFRSLPTNCQHLLLSSCSKLLAISRMYFLRLNFSPTFVGWWRSFKTERKYAQSFEQFKHR
mgnify:CR=1 FL=1